jgi:hypothetical protein
VQRDPPRRRVLAGRVQVHRLHPAVRQYPQLEAVAAHGHQMPALLIEAVVRHLQFGQPARRLFATARGASDAEQQLLAQRLGLRLRGRLGEHLSGLRRADLDQRVGAGVAQPHRLHGPGL